MISVSSPGSFDKTIKALETMKKGTPFKNLEPYGRQGVAALSSATPIESGETAQSWDFQTEAKPGRYAIDWLNTHEVEGVNIAAILQYGHGTGGGGWVEGKDYVNPAIKPVMDAAVEKAWKEVTSA